MKKILGILVILFFIIIGVKKSTQKMIPDEAIRLRVIPNSNSSYDQEMKGKVKEEIQMDLYELLKDTHGVDEARNIILNQLPSLDQKVSNVLKRENYPLNYSIDYGFHTFPKKEFEGITYEEGEYESLLITLGSGKGDNWWCVLFPPLCLIEAEESEKPEYRFFVQELIEKYLG